MIVIIVAWTCAFLLAWILLCKPNPSAYWASSAIEKSQCVATQKLHNSLAISDAILDISVVLMALPVVCGFLKVPGNKADNLDMEPPYDFNTEICRLSLFPAWLSVSCWQKLQHTLVRGQ